jgi:hypothetical protein
MESESMQRIPRHRTAAVTTLAVVAVIAGVLAIIDVLRYLGILPVVQALGMTFYGQDWLGAILSGVVAFIWFMVARQLWNLDVQGWLFVVIIAIFDLGFLALAILGGTPISSVMPHLLVNALALILAMLPGTKEAFGRI